MLCSPMKSMTRRPSQYLPAGAPKKVSPLGTETVEKAADMPPVSELESPKLKMAGKEHGGDEEEMVGRESELSARSSGRREEGAAMDIEDPEKESKQKKRESEEQNKYL